MARANGGLAGQVALALALCSAIGPAKVEAATTQTATALPYADVVAFCASHLTVDFPGSGALPEEIKKLDGPTKWRCMGGHVLVCMDSADGDWCSIKDASRIPSKGIRETCRDEPNKPYIDFATAHYSRFDWRCRHGKPVIARSYPIDARGFFMASWAPLVVRNGVVVGPKDMPDGPR